MLICLFFLSPQIPDHMHIYPPTSQNFHTGEGADFDALKLFSYSFCSSKERPESFDPDIPVCTMCYQLSSE